MLLFVWCSQLSAARSTCHAQVGETQTAGICLFVTKNRHENEPSIQGHKEEKLELLLMREQSDSKIAIGM